jgi:RNase P subunit RPR2
MASLPDFVFFALLFPAFLGLCWLVQLDRYRHPDRGGIRALARCSCPSCSGDFGEPAARRAEAEFREAMRRDFLRPPVWSGWREFWESQFRFEQRIEDKRIWRVVCPHCANGFLYHVDFPEFTRPLSPDDEDEWREKIGLSAPAPEEKMARARCPFCRDLYGWPAAEEAYRGRAEKRERTIRERGATITFRDVIDILCPSCGKVARHPARKGLWSPEEQERQRAADYQAWQVELAHRQAQRAARQARAALDPTHGYGDSRCDGCGKRRAAWADSERGVCGYCGRSLEG